jgi:Skp family chaperone for outer membrane proteins
MGRFSGRMSSRRSLVVVAVFAAIAAAGIGAGAVTSALSKPPNPPIIATVNLEVVYNGLEERKTKETEFEAKQLEFKTKLDALQASITEDRKKYDTMPAGPQKKALGQTLIRNALQLKFDGEYAEQFLDQMYGEMLREMYDKISAACRELSVKNGYTMVLTDDSSMQIRGSGRAEVNRMISLKRMLYVDPAHDVTKELVDMMNNQFNAGGGK